MDIETFVALDSEIFKTQQTFGGSFVSSSGSDPGLWCDVEQVSDLSSALWERKVNKAMVISLSLLVQGFPKVQFMCLAFLKLLSVPQTEFSNSV